MFECPFDKLPLVGKSLPTLMPEFLDSDLPLLSWADRHFQELDQLLF